MMNRVSGLLAVFALALVALPATAPKAKACGFGSSGVSAGYCPCNVGLFAIPYTPVVQTLAVAAPAYQTPALVSAPAPVYQAPAAVAAPAYSAPAAVVVSPPPVLLQTFSAASSYNCPTTFNLSSGLYGGVGVGVGPNHHHH